MMSFCAISARKARVPSLFVESLHLAPAVGGCRLPQVRTFSDAPKLVEVDYNELMKMSPHAIGQLRQAFVGPKAFGCVAVVNIPGYGKKLKKAFRAGVDLALADKIGRQRAAAVNNTYPGWSGTPGAETHPLQNSFLFNTKEEIEGGKVDPYFGKNVFPSTEYRKTWRALVQPMHDAAAQVLKGCDRVVEEEIGTQWANRSLYGLGMNGPALASRFICYDSGFTREDTLMENKDTNKMLEQSGEKHDIVGHDVTPVTSAGHAGDVLASMRAHSTSVETAGHAGDGLASMHTHSSPVKTAGHAGDGLASMRTHSTPVQTAGHAGDGLASMRTHFTPVKTAGHAGMGMGMASGTGTLASVAVKPEEISAVMGAEAVLLEWTLPHAEPDVEETSALEKTEAGDYWLPWHIDSNFVTVLHREMYVDERTTEFVDEPEGAGLLIMNECGDVYKSDAKQDVMLVQMGAFAQIYSGGILNAARHGVMSPRPPNIARFNFCNFWYVPWHTLCDPPNGFETSCINEGWNAMMDHSYRDITMRQGFLAFREFMTSPEARVQFAETVQFKELSAMFPLPIARPYTSREEAATKNVDIVADVLTDVRCPFSWISQLNFETALRTMGLDSRASVRYRPVLLNPNVSKQGEPLDDYLQREFGYTKEYAHSDNYPLRLAGLSAGIELNPHRRVVNTFDAFVLISAAEEYGKQYGLVRAISRRYFEFAEDISDENVLRAAADDAGLGEMDVVACLRDQARRDSVQTEYDVLAKKIVEIPHFLVRDRVSGLGTEVVGHKSVEEWVEFLRLVLQKSSSIGISIPGPYGRKVWLREGIPYAPVSMARSAQHGWSPEEWPYTPEDFSRIDESEDVAMYAEPRMVQHLDEASLARLTEAYRGAFQVAPPGFSVLDLCSSWESHFPAEQLNRNRVVAHGLNATELKMNQQANEIHVQDLNHNPRLPWASETFDFVTMALSVQYLTDPRAVFSEMQRVLKPGGMAIIAHSHRCFIEKAARLFARETYDGEGHTHVICRYFEHGPAHGWENITTADVSPQGADPVWLVTAVKVDE